MIRISQLKMPLGHTRKDLLLKAAKELRIQPEMIKEVELIKQSVDARKKPEIHYSYIVDIALKSGGRKEEERIVKKKKDRNITVHEEKPYSLPECGNEPLKYPPVTCRTVLWPCPCKKGIPSHPFRTGRRCRYQNRAGGKILENGRVEPFI